MRPVQSSIRALLAAVAGVCLGMSVGVYAACAQTAEPEKPPANDVLFRAIYKELVEINTTESVGDTLVAANAMAKRLLDAGFPPADVQVLSSGPRKGNMVARLRGNGSRKPVLLMAHMDVVEAKREDWDFDPFILQEKDGYFRARGSIDDKAMASIFLANLIRLRNEAVMPDRDIILALTTDEELANSPHDGARWLLENHRPLIEAELALNEGGGGTLRNGKPVSSNIQLAEKVYRSFTLEVKDPGGHSAQPRRDNAITKLAEGLIRVADYEFPARLNPVTSAYLQIVSKFDPPEVRTALAALMAGDNRPEVLAPLSKRANYNAQIRTTCVATMLEAGHAENAMAQTARATINCRLLPDENPDDVARQLKAAVKDDKIAVIPLGTIVDSPASPMSPEVIKAVEEISADMWPGIPVIPTQSGGYTDSRWLRKYGIPAYGVSGVFSEEGKSGVHGLNEQVGVKQLFEAKEFLYRLVRRVAVGDPH
ncbi:M20/M25/M40 family metallo-hydrolase [Roseiarcaceae bacterium H3SJ34-1]|uniref:M20/M25/M40 family metallo-hydrolase n=1 Tax=Terripilifer ovatus TaxID=3032367 RepID=UPI003AB9777A|nr:M20/M25/M40 family metallo-hydrolase [Roseiarcaceae bacterium H3SJ34-1]